MEDSLPLNNCRVRKSSIIINRSYMLIHSIAIAFLVYYRASFLFQQNIPTIPWILVFASELLLSFQWLLGQAYRWRPVSRIVFPERLPKDEKLPAIDVFICTADPTKEPTVGVMNTVLSAMSLDYPPEKLHVYLSDDGGSPLTLLGMREAWRFARWWLPFCRRYGIKIGCPEAYLSLPDDDFISSDELLREKKMIKEKYEMFKEAITRGREDGRLADRGSVSSADHPAVIQIMQENSSETVVEGQVKMPLLVYVSREKKPSHPHHFKGGALNVLLRVSGLISNAPYILVLDCDMYCNGLTSAKQAMCFHLDPNLSPSLAFVQFPQKFHNISENDIYDSLLSFRALSSMDGLKGPVLYGTNYYVKRESLYGSSIHKGTDLANLKNSFGPSNEFIKSLRGDDKTDIIDGTLLQETKVLASCAYEDHTNWGEKIGFLYYSVSEDYITAFNLHCKGWKSILLDPSRPQFLGTATTNLNDLLIQNTRWGSGLGDVALSRLCPLIYGPKRMSFLQSMCYAELAFFNPLHCLSLWCLAIIPQLCLLNGIPLYPEVSSSFFKVFSLIFISSLSRHLYEVFINGGSILMWRNEQRMWMIKSCTCYLFGSLDAIMKKLKLREASFVATNKTDDDEQVKLYQMGVFDFRTSTVLLVPLVTLVILNMASFIGGVIRVIFARNWERMLIQLFLSFYILIMSYAVIEGMIMRKDKGRISPYVTLISSTVSLIVLFLGSILFMY